MGADPKPTKRRKATARDLPMRPNPQGTEPTTGANGTVLQTSSLQARLPSGPDYERTVTVPTIPQLLEQSWGADPDGYWKITAGDGGKTAYLAYRWQFGEWAGHYVMVRVDRGDLTFGLTLLCEKVHQVRVGIRRPTLDRYQG